MLAPPEESVPPPRGNPGSATGNVNKPDTLRSCCTLAWVPVLKGILGDVTSGTSS